MKKISMNHMVELSGNEMMTIYGGDSAWQRLWRWIGGVLTAVALSTMPTKTEDYDHWDYYNPNDPLN